MSVKPLTGNSLEIKEATCSVKGLLTDLFNLLSGETRPVQSEGLTDIHLFVQHDIFGIQQVPVFGKDALDIHVELDPRQQQYKPGQGTQESPEQMGPAVIFPQYGIQTAS